MLYVIIRIILWPVFMLITRPRIYNRQRLNIKGSAIYVINHISMLDPVAIAVVSPRLVHFMAKKELFSGIGKPFFKSLLAFPVNRHTADLASLKQAVKVLRDGRVFGIFPEGKRSVTGKVDELEKGAAFLALRSGAPVVPIFIDPESYRKARFRMAVGEPISRGDPGTFSHSRMYEEFTARIAGAFDALRLELEEGRCGC